MLSVSERPKPEPVWNLTVQDDPEFFAGGVLVHNCDAMRYMVAELDLHSGAPRVRFMGGR